MESFQPKPARLTRVNWQQTAVITAAAFIGCLAALFLVTMLGRYMVRRELTRYLDKLDAVQRQIDAEKARPVQPVPTAQEEPQPVAPVEKPVSSRPQQTIPLYESDGTPVQTRSVMARQQEPAPETA